MKHYAVKILMLTFLCLAFQNTSAQDNTDTFENKNEIGILVSDLINGSYHIRYERYFKNRFSAVLGLGYKGEDGLLRLSGLDTDFIKTNNLTYSGFKIVPEVRYYLNDCKGTNSGFYVGIFAKLSRFKSDLYGTFISEDSQEYMFDYDAEINISSGGFMVGYKFNLSKKFTLDFIIAGPGVGSFNYSLTKNKEVPDEFYDKINQALNDYTLFDLINADIEIDSNDYVEKRFTAYSYRYGVSVAYKF